MVSACGGEHAHNSIIINVTSFFMGSSFPGSASCVISEERSGEHPATKIAGGRVTYAHSIHVLYRAHIEKYWKFLYQVDWSPTVCGSGY